MDANKFRPCGSKTFKIATEENYMIKHESNYGGNPYTKRERERERNKHKNLLFFYKRPPPNPASTAHSLGRHQKNLIEYLSPHV
jgi:hypothetical protein